MRCFDDSSMRDDTRSGTRTIAMMTHHGIMLARVRVMMSSVTMIVIFTVANLRNSHLAKTDPDRMRI